MVGPVTLYVNGLAALTPDRFASIKNGDRIVVLDSRGNAVDMKDLFVSTYDADFGPKPLAPLTPMEPQNWERAPETRDFMRSSDTYKAWPVQPKDVYEQPKAPEALPFKGTSTYNADFVPHEIPKRHYTPPVSSTCFLTRKRL